MVAIIFVCVFLSGSFFIGANAVDEATVITEEFLEGSLKVVTEDINGTEFYRPNEKLTWQFDLAEGTYVLLESSYFDLELSQDCINSCLEWNFKDSSQIATNCCSVSLSFGLEPWFDKVGIIEDEKETLFCGSGPLVYILQGSHLEVYFESDESYEGQGFSLRYKILDIGSIADSRCNSAIIELENAGKGEIFDSDKVCYYRLQAVPGHIVKLNLKVIGFGSRTCEEESLKIYRGASTHGELLKEICAGTVQGPISVYEEKLFIEYKRSFEVEDGNENFIIDYEFVENTLTTTLAPPTTPSPVGGDNDCSRFVDDRTEGFTYTVPPFTNDKECIFVVRNTRFQNHVIQVHFEYFDLEESEDCIFDALRVISGERNDSQSLGGPYCGTSLNGKTLLTYGNSLRLEFKTDQSFALRGFEAKISFVSRTACSCIDTRVCVRTGYEKKCLSGERCTDSPCLNGGTCIQTRTSKQCYCRQGYTGELCAERVGDLGFIRFKSTPPNRVVKRGEVVTEKCLVDTNQTADYIWTFNGEQISDYSQANGFGILTVGYLQIDKFDEEMEGLYTCAVTVGGTKAEIYFEYKLVETCQSEFEVKPSDITANVGGSAIFSCSVSNAKKVFWKKDGIELDIDNLPNLSILEDTSYLKIYPVEESDSGTYTCTALDDDYCETSRHAKLSVTKIETINNYCGMSIYDEATLKGYISQGQESRIGENPWHVTLFSIKKDAPFCGGSVISQSYVLTAAHCITQAFENLDNVKLIFGSTDCKGKNADVVRYAEEIIVHPDFEGKGNFDHDIALIKLRRKINYGKLIRPICLQRAAFYEIKFMEKRSKVTKALGKVAGCGEGIRQLTRNRNALMEVNLPYVPREDCEEVYEGRSEITENMFCAGSRLRDIGDTCAGDSGGAYVMSDDTRWFQTGIVSHGAGCDKRNFYTVYTHVGQYYNWIREKTDFDKEEVDNFLGN